MTQFRLTKPFVIYKVEKGSSQTISNAIMTDDLAVKFLKVNPDRIHLFSEYPENWFKLVGIEEPKIDVTENLQTDKPKSSDTKKGCTDCKKKSQLLNTKMGDLREAYPEIKATSKQDFVRQILTLNEII
ncbi:hypothetical protein [Leeuwenhoekiella sp. NPDC079379]|uniref:hypothetical protein n=1 Tax=Leeuwenhoekiella sp. NPDC079379 TaxID=3364122 RepID=UPI0037CB7770